MSNQDLIVKYHQIGTKIPLYHYQLEMIQKMSEMEEKIVKDWTVELPWFSNIINFKVKDLFLLGPFAPGKSIITLCLCHKKKGKNFLNLSDNYEVETSATLILCPNRLVYEWKLEIEKFTDLKCFVLDPKKKKNFTYQDLVQYDIIICGFDFLDDYLSNTLQEVYLDYLEKKRGKKEKKVQDFLKTKLCIKSVKWTRIIKDNEEEFNAKIHSLRADYKWNISPYHFFEYSRIFAKMGYIDKIHAIIDQHVLLSKSIFLEIEEEKVKKEVGNIGYEEKKIYLNFNEKEKNIYNEYLSEISSDMNIDSRCLYDPALMALKTICLFPYKDENKLKTDFKKSLEDSYFLENFVATFNRVKKYLKKNHNLILTHLKSSEEKLELIQRTFQEIETEPFCKICSEVPEHSVTLLTCCHYFCKDCFSYWKRIMKNCPVCRRKENLKFYDFFLLSREIKTEKNITSISNIQNQEKYGTKIAGLIQFLEEKISQEPDSQFIIYLNSAEYVQNVQKILHSFNYSCVSFFMKNTTSIIDQFRNRFWKFLLLTPDQMYGLNLKDVQNLIFLEYKRNRPVSEFSDEEIIKRITKIGNTKRLSIYKFIIKDTIEEQIDDYISKYFKKDLESSDPNAKKAKISTD